MSCEFEHLDGSYVLGALAPGERQEFEHHLSGCAECARAVQELAGMPGLLARVDAETLGESPEIPVPDTLLPSLVREARRVGHRRTVTTALLSAAAVTLAAGVLVGTGVLGGGNPNDAAPQSPHSSIAAAPTRDMVPVVPTPVRASLGFVPVAWGTRIDMTCTYVPGYGEGEHHPPGTYVLVVRTRDGRTEQVAAWRALPGTMRLSAATDASPADIASVEVRTSTGAPVLRLST